jgi:hypothetical protein
LEFFPYQMDHASVVEGLALPALFTLRASRPGLPEKILFR